MDSTVETPAMQEAGVEEMVISSLRPEREIDDNFRNYQGGGGGPGEDPEGVPPGNPGNIDMNGHGSNGRRFNGSYRGGGERPPRDDNEKADDDFENSEDETTGSNDDN